MIFQWMKTRGPYLNVRRIEIGEEMEEVGQCVVRKLSW